MIAWKVVSFHGVRSASMRSSRSSPTRRSSRESLQVRVWPERSGAARKAETDVAKRTPRHVRVIPMRTSFKPIRLRKAEPKYRMCCQMASGLSADRGHVRTRAALQLYPLCDSAPLFLFLLSPRLGERNQSPAHRKHPNLSCAENVTLGRQGSRALEAAPRRRPSSDSATI